MSRSSDTMKPKFEPTADGLEIIDPIERHRYQLTMSGSVSLEEASADRIGFPIGSVVQVTTTSIELPTTESVIVRDSDGMMLAGVSPTEQAEFQPNEYTIDLSGPLKVYAHVNSPVHIFSDSKQTYVNFDEETDVILGARSLHKRPAGTITTTSEPADVMAAVSAFGSELKTTAPERSYSTLRGHPPRLEVGNELQIPTAFEQPDHGVWLEVPETLQHVFVVAPLAYYLGATITPGSSPRLVTERGYTHALEDVDGFESAVRRTLKQIFFLDCIVRTEGKTPLPLHERQVAEPVLNFDVSEAYEQPLAERIETYLRTPSTALEPYLPDWRFETQLQPTADRIAFLPFLANDLAVVTIDENKPEPTAPKPVVQQAIEEFTRDDFVRSARPNPVRGNKTVGKSTSSPQLPTIQQSWTGINDTEIISTTPVSAYQNSIGRTPKDGPIEIDVVCNDQEMRAELESVNGTYGTCEELPFDITIHYDLSSDGLEDVLAADSDFLHYIGHIDDEGFQCSDGKLDAAAVETVGVKAFLLNACQSHDQGLHLVETGSIGGIVTFGNIVNSAAVDVGSLIARLLNLGFPLYGALDIARQENIVGQQYLMVGDGQATIAQSKTRVPNVCLISENEINLLTEIVVYASADSKRGSVFSPHIDSIESYYVIPGKTGETQVAMSELKDFFEEALFPVVQNGQVQWSKDLIK